MDTQLATRSQLPHHNNTQERQTTTYVKSYMYVAIDEVTTST